MTPITMFELHWKSLVLVAFSVLWTLIFKFYCKWFQHSLFLYLHLTVLCILHPFELIQRNFCWNYAFDWWLTRYLTSLLCSLNKYRYKYFEIKWKSQKNVFYSWCKIQVRIWNIKIYEWWKQLTRNISEVSFNTNINQ